MATTYSDAALTLFKPSTLVSQAAVPANSNVTHSNSCQRRLGYIGEVLHHEQNVAVRRDRNIIRMIIRVEEEGFIGF